MKGIIPRRLPARALRAPAVAATVALVLGGTQPWNPETVAGPGTTVG
jgi:hypothetical protein